MIDAGVIIVAVTGRLITPPHLDSFTGFVRARLAERWGQDRLVSEPSHETTSDNE